MTAIALVILVWIAVSTTVAAKAVGPHRKHAGPASDTWTEAAGTVSVLDDLKTGDLKTWFCDRCGIIVTGNQTPQHRHTMTDITNSILERSH